MHLLSHRGSAAQRAGTPVRHASFRTAALAAVLLLAAPACASAQLSRPPSFPALAAAVPAPPAPDDDALVIPVEGVEPEDLRDTFHAPRGGGREHLAIDIHAPRGTPVYAAADGTIFRLTSGSRGGITIYQLDDDGHTRYYYAHLERYAEGLEEGDQVERGEVIGYVGDTGNAAPGDYHLHFSVAVLEDARRWWEGDSLNPYPLLRAAGRDR